MREGRVAELRLVLPSSACKPLVSLFGGGETSGIIRSNPVALTSRT